MLEIPAHAYEHGREKEEGEALMVACAQGGAAEACTAFESYRGSQTLSMAALAAVASSPQCVVGHEPRVHTGMRAG